MKTIIAGSRGLDNALATLNADLVADVKKWGGETAQLQFIDELCYDEVKTAITRSGFTVTEVVSGRARGVDKLGEKYAIDNNIPVKEFPAYWNTYGKTAGFRRNNEMAKYADALVAVWDGRSKGTRHMIDTATREGLRVYVQVVGEKGK